MKTKKSILRVQAVKPVLFWVVLLGSSVLEMPVRDSTLMFLLPWYFTIAWAEEIAPAWEQEQEKRIYPRGLSLDIGTVTNVYQIQVVLYQIQVVLMSKKPRCCSSKPSCVFSVDGYYEPFACEIMNKWVFCLEQDISKSSLSNQWSRPNAVCRKNRVLSYSVHVCAGWG